MHDKHCPWRDTPGSICICMELKAAKADERRRCIRIVHTLHDQEHGDPKYVHGWCDAIGSARIALVEEDEK